MTRGKKEINCVERRERGISIHWSSTSQFNLQMVATARSRQGKSQDPRTPHWSPTWVAGTQVLHLPRCNSKKLKCKQGSWDSKRHLNWDASIVSTGLTHFATMPVPSFGITLLFLFNLSIQTNATNFKYFILTANTICSILPSLYNGIPST